MGPMSAMSPTYPLPRSDDRAAGKMDASPHIAASGRVATPAVLRLELGPGVPEAEGAVEDEPPGRRVGIRAEVAEALELHGLTDRQFRERRLDQAPWSTVSELGLRSAKRSPSAPGSGRVKRRS